MQKKYLTFLFRSFTFIVFFCDFDKIVLFSFIPPPVNGIGLENTSTKAATFFGYSETKRFSLILESRNRTGSSKTTKHRYKINYKIRFYCVNTSYPMDNGLSGRRRPARQTSEKDVLCFHRPGWSSAVHSPGGVWYFLPV